MNNPTCEIADVQVAISTCAVKYTVNRRQYDIDGSMSAAERRGSAWGKAAESPEHISVDELQFLENAALLAGKQFCSSQPPRRKLMSQQTEAMLKLFELPKDEGDIFISIDKHRHAPNMASPLDHVYTAAAFMIESPGVDKVRSHGWPTPAEAINALFNDLAVKVTLKHECPIHFALQRGQIQRPLGNTLEEYESHTDLWENLPPLTAPLGINIMMMHRTGDGMMVCRLGKTK